MSGSMPDQAELARMEMAADWLRRLHAAPNDEALAVEWFDWCQAQPENLQAFERMQAVWQAFDGRGCVPAPRTKLTSGVRRKWMAGFALAAGVALAAALAWWQIPALFERPARTLTTDVAEHGSQILSDGSRVDLGARTRIATRYTAAQRTVEVETGEAFFEVAKDAGRPFVVQAGAVRVTALGTAFSVRRTLDRTVVIVSEGLVSVAPTVKSAATDPSHELRAGAGERITFSATDNRLSVANVDPKTAQAWRDGVLKFVDEPLAAVIDDVNRYALHPISVADPRLRERLYTGTVYRDRIDDWLHALERVFPLQVVETPAGEVILAPKVSTTMSAPSGADVAR